MTQVWKYMWLCEPHADQDQALVGRRVNCVSILIMASLCLLEAAN